MNARAVVSRSSVCSSSNGGFWEKEQYVTLGIDACGCLTEGGSGLNADRPLSVTR